VFGLDLGASQVRALLYAPDGTVLGHGAVGFQDTPRMAQR
jgi:sugar (pentulose or hexulose) kinase